MYTRGIVVKDFLNEMKLFMIHANYVHLLC